jgi:hypothetical protein
MAAAGFAALIDIETGDPTERPKIDVRLIKA